MVSKVISFRVSEGRGGLEPSMFTECCPLDNRISACLLRRPELLHAQSSRTIRRSNVVFGAFPEAKGKGKFVIQTITFRVMPRDAFWKTLPSSREGSRLKVHAEFGVGIPVIWEEEEIARTE